MSVLTVPNLRRKSLGIDLSNENEKVFRTQCMCVCGTSQLVGKFYCNAALSACSSYMTKRTDYGDIRDRNQKRCRPTVLCGIRKSMQFCCRLTCKLQITLSDI
jgi:hypothetical protein